jgi:hypothetical protein
MSITRCKSEPIVMSERHACWLQCRGTQRYEGIY